MKVATLLITFALLTEEASSFASPVFAKSVAKASKKKVAVAKATNKKAPIKKAAPTKKVKSGKKTAEKENDGPSLPSLPSLSLGGPISLAGKAMGLLSPLFTLEAKIQAGIGVFAADFVGVPFRVYPEKIRKATGERVKKGPILYTYGLSPFSGEAKSILEDYNVEIEELGLEWFLLGPGGSEKRLVLAELSPNDQTSLPHLFLKGESLGGLSTGGRNNAGIVGLKESGELDKLLTKKKISKKR